MKVKCIKEFADLILEGNEYDVIKEKQTSYRIKNEKGKVNNYPKAIFKVVETETFNEDIIETVEVE